METILKASVSLFLDENSEPVGMIYFNANRERVIYIINKANEEQMIALFENKDTKIKGDNVVA